MLHVVRPEPFAGRLSIASIARGNVMLTIRQLLGLPLMSEARLVAGASGIEREVLWSAVVDIPQASEWVRAGELLLTTFYGLRDDVEAQVTLCARLANKHLAGMIVA